MAFFIWSPAGVYLIIPITVEEFWIYIWCKNNPLATKPWWMKDWKCFRRVVTLSWDNCLKMKLLVIISATPLLLSTLIGAQHNNFDPIPTNVARQHFNVDQSKSFVSQIPLRDVMEWCHNTNQYCFINRDRDHWHLDNQWYLFPYNSKQE